MSIPNKEITDETLKVIPEAFTADELFQSCAADGFPVTYYQCKVVADLSVETIQAGGFYTMFSKVDDQGVVLNFFDKEGQLTNNIVINRPEISKERKIPKLNWLKGLFKAIGYAEDRIEIKYIHRIIESHIRDGGSWTPSCNGDTIVFILKMNGQVKSHMEFHREVLT